MTDTHDEIWELYYTAFHTVLTWPGDLHERLAAAVNVLKSKPALLELRPQDEFDGQMCLPLRELVETGKNLDSMTWKEMQDFAWRIWTVYQEVTEAGEAQVQRAYDAELE